LTLALRPLVAEGAGASVLTYHGDTLRTGWNASEVALKPSNVNASTFGILATVELDGQVDAQPLVLASESGNRAYVVTENDSVYAIDTASGAILVKRHFGTPVPRTAFPSGCPLRGSPNGIMSTPVIDPVKHRLYLIADTYANGTATYRIHALDTATLADSVAPVVVAARHQLANGATVTFSAATQQQRPALLEANDNIYAGFGSYCDKAANVTRGWVLGWKTETLAPLAANELTDTLATSQKDYFLSSLWMSGAGLAADSTGSIYFITGNSDPTSYDGVDDIQESIVREEPGLSKVQTIFTPSDQPTLDAGDKDFGAGGPLLVPNQKSGTFRHLAVAAGKDGNLFILNRDSLGGFSPNGNNVLGTVSIGGCWCAQSYYVGSDGIQRVVTSGGDQVGIWQLQNAPSVTLTQQSASAELATGQDPGFFTSVSSNGTTAGTAIVWAVSRPTDRDPADVDLYAFNPTNAATLFSAVAGTWPYTGADSDLVPVVANGVVLVASYEQITIFGLLPPGGSARTALKIDAPAPPPLAPNVHEMYGQIVGLAGTRLTMRTRTGRTVPVDVAAAERAYATATLYPGEFILVRGTAAPGGGLVAATVNRAKSSPALWEPDR
jgi:hypothetical protein